MVAVAVLHRVEDRRPRRPRRARRSPDLGAKWTKPSRISGFGASRAKAGAASSGRAASPGPCRHSRAGWSSAPPAGRSRRRPRPVRLGLDRAPGRGRHAGAVRGRSSPRIRSWLIRRTRARAGRAPATRRARRLGADILELEADHIDRRGECAQRRRRRRSRDGRRGGHLPGRAVLLRVRRCGSDSRAGPRPAPTSGRAGRRRRGRWWRSGGSGKRRRCRLMRVGSAGLGHAVGLRRAPGIQPRGQRRVRWRRMAAASSAAFTAPARPIASVPTGMPAGICTIESRLSMPLSAWHSTGTPSTGSGVQAAHMPGRCAAPPAPAMMTFSPRPRAPSA